MITNNKKRKEVKFHKVETNNFNRAKKFNANKSSNEINLKENISPITRRDKREPTRSSFLENFLRNVEEKYSIRGSPNIFKKTNKKNDSTNQIKSLKYKEMIQNKNKTQREKQKNIVAKKPLILKQDEKKEKEKNISVKKHLKYCKTLDNNRNKKIFFENEKNSCIANYNSNKTNRSKKSKKTKENKEEKKNNDDTLEKEKTENLVKTIKRKFCCCL